MKSILQSEKECFFCGWTGGLHKHHVIFGRGYREISERLGLWVWLCPKHHNMSNEGVHFNRTRDLELKRYAQRKYEESHSHEEWMDVIGRNYL